MTAVKTIALGAAMLSATLSAVAARVDFSAGQRSFASKCAICHNIDAAAGHAVGPNLHGVVGRDVGTAPGFGYSPAVAGKGGVWNPPALMNFLRNPQAEIPGTVMPFAGLKSEADRKAIICFLSGDPGSAACD
jgi:cytochrome c